MRHCLGSDRRKGHFPLGRNFPVERHFLLFEDQLMEIGRQKTKENIIPRGKFPLVENRPKADWGNLATSFGGQSAIGKEVELPYLFIAARVLLLLNGLDGK